MARELKGSMEQITLDIQEEYLPHVFNLGRALKFNMQHHHYHKGEWQPHPTQIGRWIHPKIPNVYFVFPPRLLVLSQSRKIGQVRAVGKPSSEKNIAGRVDARDSEIPVSEVIKYAVGKIKSAARQRRRVIGYSVTAKFETEFGSEAAGVKATVGFEATQSGEFSSETAETEERNDLEEYETSFTAPAGVLVQIVQTIKETDVEIDVVDKLLIDMPFEIWTYHSHPKGYAKGSPDLNWHKPASLHFKSKGVVDLDLTLKGKNRRYPHIPKNAFHKWTAHKDINGKTVNVKNIHGFFQKESRREFTIKTILERRDGTFSDINVSTTRKK